MKKQTLAIHQAYKRRDTYDVLSMSVYNVVAFGSDNAEVMTSAFYRYIDAPDYSRMGNPMVTNLEQRARTLTDVENVIALNPGMAAVNNTLFSVVKQGKNIIASRHLFSNTYSLLTSTSSRLGVEAGLCSLIGIEIAERLIDGRMCYLFLEVMTNSQLRAVDVCALSVVTHRYSIAVIADIAFIPFTQFSTEDLGIDLEVVSNTRYISGGATSLGGLVIDYSTCPPIGKHLSNEMLFDLGVYTTPQVVYIQTLGLKILGIHHRVQTNNALELAQRLRTLRPICKVNYVGPEDDPYHQLIASRYGEAVGAMATVDLKDQEACFKILNSLGLIHRMTSLFNNRTSAIHPASVIFGPFTTGKRAVMDAQGTTMRPSVGLESVDDLSSSIKQTLGT